MSLNALLISPAILKSRMVIHDNIDEKMLFPEIKLAQDMFIHPLLGTALYDKIVTDINASGTTTGDYKDLLDNYIIDCLCYYVMAGLPMGISYQFWNKGVLRKTGENTEIPDMTELVTISDRYRERAEWYGERLTKYLQQNADTNFLPEYLQPGSGLDTIQPEITAFTMPIFLGLDYDDPCYDTDNTIDLE